MLGNALVLVTFTTHSAEAIILLHAALSMISFISPHDEFFLGFVDANPRKILL